MVLARTQLLHLLVMHLYRSLVESSLVWYAFISVYDGVVALGCKSMLDLWQFQWLFVVVMLSESIIAANYNIILIVKLINKSIF